MWAASTIFALLCGASNYAIAAPPGEWVENVQAPQPGRTPAPGEELEVLLEDVQVRPADEPVRYTRRVVVPRSPQAVQDSSQLLLRYRPGYQSLRVHHVERRRGDEVVDALANADVRPLRREERAGDEHFYDEETVLIILKDIQVGDVIDYAWSVSGANPALGDHFSDLFYLGGEHPAALVRYRLLWPRDRYLAHQTQQLSLLPTNSWQGDDNVWVWQREPAPALAREDLLPDGYDPAPRVELSSWRSWEEVARWGAGLYGHTLPSSQQTEALLTAWRALPNNHARVVAALEFVQEQVRYLDVELGAHSLEPHPPAEVLNNRYGDSKDKAMLLVALLREMGINAAPVLVHTRQGEQLRERLPSVHAFNHVVVQVTLDRTYLLDGTITHQRGPLEERQVFNLGWGLVLQPNTRDLTELVRDSPTEPQVVVEESFFTNEEGQESLAVVTTYRGEWAHAQRRKMATHSPQEMEKDNTHFYDRLGLQVESVRVPEVEDDVERNRLVVRELYRLSGPTAQRPELWRAWHVAQHLSTARVVQRNHPLRVGHPLYVEHRVRLAGASPPEEGEDPVLRLEGEALVFTQERRQEGNALEWRFTLRTLQSRVEPSRVSEHLALVEKINAATLLNVGHAGGGASSVTRLVVMNGIVGLLVLGALLWGPLQRRRKGQSPKGGGRAPVRRQPASVVQLAANTAEAAVVRLRRENTQDGRTPESSIHVTNMLAAVAYAASGEPHSCGGSLRLARDEPPRRKAVEEGEVLEFTLTCSKCGKEQPQYFRLE